MSNTTKLPPFTPFLHSPKSLYLPSNRLPFSITKPFSDVLCCFKTTNKDFIQQGSVPFLHSSYSPVSLDLKPILNDSEFYHVIDEAQQLDELVVVLWMANWCRKCIYLKPKLEKLAANYHPRVKFYCIDVNNVPYKLVVRAGVTLWKDGKKQAEVIGGHKAHLVANKVREMIDDEGQP